jgi:hypothetical protein
LEAEKNTAHPSATLRRAVTEVTEAVATLDCEKTSWKFLGTSFEREYNGYLLTVTPTAVRSVFLWAASPYARPSTKGSAYTLEDAQKAAEAATKGED